MTPPARGAVRQLIALVNEQTWIGHFDLWTTGGMVMFRHAPVLAGVAEPPGKQCEALLETVLDAATFETSGEA